MKTRVRRYTLLGELVVAAFDAAAQVSADPQVVSRLATSAVEHVLRRARRTSWAPKGARPRARCGGMA
jgi:hypothetical protein